MAVRLPASLFERQGILPQRPYDLASEVSDTAEEQDFWRRVTLIPKSTDASGASNQSSDERGKRWRKLIGPLCWFLCWSMIIFSDGSVCGCLQMV